MDEQSAHSVLAWESSQGHAQKGGKLSGKNGSSKWVIPGVLPSILPLNLKLFTLQSMTGEREENRRIMMKSSFLVPFMSSVGRLFYSGLPWKIQVHSLSECRVFVIRNLWPCSPFLSCWVCGSLKNEMGWVLYRKGTKSAGVLVFWMPLASRTAEEDAAGLCWPMWAPGDVFFCFLAVSPCFNSLG